MGYGGGFITVVGEAVINCVAPVLSSLEPVRSRCKSHHFARKKYYFRWNVEKELKKVFSHGDCANHTILVAYFISYYLINFFCSCA